MGQSLTRIYLHLVFSTKDRRPFIDNQIELDLHDYLWGICKGEGAEPIMVNGMTDHIHMLIDLPRDKTISDLVRHIKGGSSKWIKTKNQNYQLFSWQRGYSAFSIGQSQIPIVKQYISKQKAHHQKFDYQKELTSLLEKYQIQYNPQYLWD